MVLFWLLFKVFKSFLLSLAGSPKLVFPNSTSEVNSKFFDRFSMSCNFTAYPPVLATWSVPTSDVPFSDSKDPYIITTTQDEVGDMVQVYTQLDVFNMTKPMLGTFVCSTTNSAGIAMAKIQLNGEQAKQSPSPTSVKL